MAQAGDSGPGEGSRRWLVPAVLFLVALALRSLDLGRLSLWYDEVVSMHLARQSGPMALLERLEATDATRAPLHPFLLQGWLAVFGTSDLAGRSFSVVCGVVTVGLIGWIGTVVFDRRAGLAAAWLAAICPPLVVYSREVRMYALLTLLTCLAWALVLRPGGLRGIGRSVVYVVLLAALAYCHPLGLIMAVTLAGVCLAESGRSWFSLRRWFVLHSAALALVAPWLGHFLDHDPESVTGPLPLKFLLGMPIAFVGGNALTLVGIVFLAALGCLGRGTWPRPGIDRRALPLVAWFVVPPTALYLYSLVGHPLFGPVRYTLFSAPACLLLIAGGLSHLPRRTSLAVLCGLSLLTIVPLKQGVFAPDLKADWRAAALFLGDRPASEPLLVTSSDPSQNVEVEAARYYVEGSRRVEAWPIEDDEWPSDLLSAPSAWISEPVRDGKIVAQAPEFLGPFAASGEVKALPGLRLVRLVRRPEPGPVTAP
ncbi:glycosyltransferase family 39 protein [Isosphaeraceae bacterium EP7]